MESAYSVKLELLTLISEKLKYMLKLEAMRVFVAVAETGSLAAAANRIGRTPGAVSMTLKQAEEEIGGALFDADRKARLTPLGTTVLRNCRHALEAYAAAMGEIERYTRGDEGTLRLASTPSIARRVLPLIVSSMLKTRPNLQFEIRDVDSQSVAELTTAGLVDFGIASLSAASRGLKAEMLLEDKFHVVCLKGHPLTVACEPVTWEALSAYDFIHNGLCDAIGSQAVAKLSVTARLRARNVGALFGLIESGLGVTILPSLAVPAEGSLTSVPLADQAATSRVHLLSRDGDAASPIALLFRDAILRSIRSI